jgi:flavin-dependent dehydrogenase
MEAEILFQNPALKRIFQNSEFLFDKPEVINEISFAPKKPVEAHILMSGDAAGMITPLCGNGMAMAIHAAKLLSDTLIVHHQAGRSVVEDHYRKLWNRHFSQRHWAGRQIQRLFGKKVVSEMSVHMARRSKPVARFLMEKTHGTPFQ